MNTDYKQSIIDYYNNTQLDYRWLWFRNGSRSVHFGYYDDGVTSHSDALVNMNRRMARKVSIQDGDTILDAGCGQGDSALWLAEQYDVRVTGITLVPHQVEIARKEATDRILTDTVAFHQQDYNRTTFRDESFSVIWACESMCHAQNKADFYKEAYRLLKQGGRLIAADYIRSERPLHKNDEVLLQQWLTGWSIPDLDTYDEHSHNAASAGFSYFELEDITLHTRPSLQHLHSMAKKLWKLGKVLKKIKLRNKVNHGNHFASIKQYEALEKKLWFYGLISLKKE